MAFLGGLGRLLLLFLNVGAVIAGLAILISVLLLVFVAAPAFLIGYIATKILYWLYTRVVVTLRPSSYSRLHRWKPARNLLILTVIGVMIWICMNLAINRFGHGYLSFTYQMICSTADWAAPIAAEQAIQNATMATQGEQAVPPADRKKRCDVLIAKWLPWLSDADLRALAIGLILAMVVLTRWKRMTTRARRTALVEREDPPPNLRARPV